MGPSESLWLAGPAFQVEWVFAEESLMLTLSFFPSYFHPLSPQNNLLYLSRCTAVLQVFPQEGRERRPPLCVYRYPTNPPTLAHGPALPPPHRPPQSVFIS